MQAGGRLRKPGTYAAREDSAIVVVNMIEGPVGERQHKKLRAASKPT